MRGCRSLRCNTASARSWLSNSIKRDVGDDAGEVDRRFDAGVAAADHRHALALEERAVAMRAVGDALAAVFAPRPARSSLRQRAPVGEDERCAP